MEDDEDTLDNFAIVMGPPEGGSPLCGSKERVDWMEKLQAKSNALVQEIF